MPMPASTDPVAMTRRPPSLSINMPIGVAAMPATSNAHENAPNTISGRQPSSRSMSGARIVIA